MSTVKKLHLVGYLIAYLPLLIWYLSESLIVPSEKKVLGEKIAQNSVAQYHT